MAKKLYRFGAPNYMHSCNSKNEYGLHYDTELQNNIVLVHGLNWTSTNKKVGNIF